MFAGIIFYLIYARGNYRRFLLDKEEAAVKRPMTKFEKAVIVFLIITFIPITAMFYFGERAPAVNIHNDSVHIRGLYRVSVPFSDIAGISLVPQSMREIGPGRRTNGYATGNTWQGHFQAGTLFVQADSSPTIKIQRYNGRDVFLSFRDIEQTEDLYYLLIRVMG